MTFFRKLSSAVAVASLFAAAPAFAGNRDGFGPESKPVEAAEYGGKSTTEAAKPDCASCPHMSRDEGSGGGAGDRVSTLASDPFDRSMDAGG